MNPITDRRVFASALLWLIEHTEGHGYATEVISRLEAIALDESGVAALTPTPARTDIMRDALKAIAEPPNPTDPCRCEHDDDSCCAFAADYHCPMCIAAKALADSSLPAVLGPQKGEDLETNWKDLYAEGLQTGIEMGRRLGDGGDSGVAAGVCRSSRPRQIDQPHTGDDELLDALTGARVALEEWLEDLDTGDAEAREAMETALEALTDADRLRVAELTARADARAEGPTTPCVDCGAALNEGEAKCFTVCDDCWRKHYPVPPAAPGAEDATKGAEGSFDIRTLAAEYGWIYTGHVVDWLRCRLEELRMLRAASPAPAWMPIETAPKDGTKVMVYGCEWHRHVYGTGYYFKGVPGDGEGWIAHSFYTAPQDDARGSFTPTHWQPLPSPPSAGVVPSAQETVCVKCQWPRSRTVPLPDGSHICDDCFYRERDQPKG